MTEPQPFDAVDELYRRTFEDLPASPAASGWDTPSPRVWDNIRRQMPQTRGGWSLNGWLIAGSLMLLLGMGIWLWMPAAERAVDMPAQEGPQATMPGSAPARSPAVQEDIPSTEVLLAPVSKAPVSAPSVAKSPVKPKAVTPVPVDVPVKATALPVQAAPAQKEEGSQAAPVAPRYPNNAERRRAEALKKQWDTPLQPLPDVLEKQKRW